MKPRTIYLACPYTHPNPRVRQERHDAAVAAAGLLMSTGARIFCPIAHTHNIDLHLQEQGIEIEHEEWLAQDKPFILGCDLLIVLMFPGWEASTGVRHEVDLFKKLSKPIMYLGMDDFNRMMGGPAT